MFNLLSGVLFCIFEINMCKCLGILNIVYWKYWIYRFKFRINFDYWKNFLCNVLIESNYSLCNLLILYKWGFKRDVKIKG